MRPVPSVFEGTANVIAVFVLLSEFAMLRAALLRSQIRLYAIQSLLVSALAVVVAATRNIPELYVLAALSLALKVVIVPRVILRLLRRAEVDLAGSNTLGVASTVLLAIGAAGFAFFAVGRGFPGRRVLLVGERSVGGEPRGRVRPPFDPRGGVPVRPAGGGHRVRSADASPSRPNRDPQYRGAQQVEGVSGSSAVLIAIVVIPLAAAAAGWWGSPRVRQASAVAAGVAVFGLSLALVPAAASPRIVRAGAWLRADALSVVFLVSSAFLYALTATYSVGYLRSEEHTGYTELYTRRFFAGLNIFAWSMVCAAIVDGLALLWVAIEVTTVVSALLVAIEDSDGATEAAWKYVLIASVGLGIALLATIVMYYAGSQVFGAKYELFFDPLLRAAPRFPAVAVRLAYVWAVLGFGTKVGLVPVHTWLPDAHAEAPTPVSAMLSGGLLAASFYAILRYYQIAARALGPRFPQIVLLVFGVASLLLAALYVLEQRDLKRLLAYSSVEHMGILAIGVSFGAPLALAGVLLHVLAHAAAKGTAFFGAGAMVLKLKTKDMAGIRGGFDLLPWSGPILLLAMLALSAMPPFGIFRSEFLIVAGGLQGAHNAMVVVLVTLVTVAFLGLSFFATRMMLTPSPGPAVRGEISPWMVVPMVTGMVALLVLGIHPPAELQQLLARAVGELRGVL
jgi:hydrogenase-4 component F